MMRNETESGTATQEYTPDNKNPNTMTTIINQTPVTKDPFPKGKFTINYVHNRNVWQAYVAGCYLPCCSGETLFDVIDKIELYYDTPEGYQKTAVVRYYNDILTDWSEYYQYYREDKQTED